MHDARCMIHDARLKGLRATAGRPYSSCLLPPASAMQGKSPHFENEWQSFRTKKQRTIELTSVFHECAPGRRKPAVKVVDIFGNDTMIILDVKV